MKVSVIIPLYNKALYIQRSLDSVLAQTYWDFELIVVDDGSTDGGADAARNCHDPRFTLIRQENAGPGAARNRGLREARGQYVVFLDADDEWLPEFLQESIAGLEQHGPEVATISSGHFYWPAGRSTEARWRSRGLREGVWRVTPDLSPALLRDLLAYMSPCSTVARTSVILKWGGFYDRHRCLYGEDSWLWLKVLLNHPVAIHMTPLVRIHTEASELDFNRTGPHEVEPFLLHADELESACPAALRELLGKLLAMRAFATASQLTGHGGYREGRKLLRQFHCSAVVPSRRFLALWWRTAPLGFAVWRGWRRFIESFKTTKPGRAIHRSLRPRRS